MIVSICKYLNEDSLLNPYIIVNLIFQNPTRKGIMRRKVDVCTC